jgi:hypothetical protein
MEKRPFGMAVFLMVFLLAISAMHTAPAQAAGACVLFLHLWESILSVKNSR